MTCAALVPQSAYVNDSDCCTVWLMLAISAGVSLSVCSQLWVSAGMHPWMGTSLSDPHISFETQMYFIASCHNLPHVKLKITWA